MEEYELEHTGCARQEAVLVRGGNRLCGELTVQGAKNSTLPLLAAAILCEGETVLHNCPALSDVHTAVTILRRLGCRCTHTGDTLTVCADGMTRCDIPHSLMREMRSSIVFLGAILSRCGEARLSFPGGCELGPRPIDLHLEALRKLGAEIREEHGCLLCTAPGGLRGGFVSLAFPSVGATENAMIAACAAEGATVIYNAAREPEIETLQSYLCALGADVSGAGSPVIRITGFSPRSHAGLRIPPDRIAAATYLCCTACAGGEIELTAAAPGQIVPVLDALRTMGCAVSTHGDRIHMTAHGRPASPGAIVTRPYPGFPTDLQSLYLAAAMTLEGKSCICENVFEDRLRTAEELQKMGGTLQICGKWLTAEKSRLHGAEVVSQDLRGGAALVSAALAAEGFSTIRQTELIERGYERFPETLRELGAKIIVEKEI